MSSRILALLGVVVLLGGGLVIVVGALTGGDFHTLRASFDSAVQLAPGQEVRIAGRKIGEITAINVVDGRAVVDLEVRDSNVWPLHRGTTAGTRWGSTTSLAYRYVEIYPGPASAPALPDNGVLTAAYTKTAVELDQSYRIFRGRTRGDLRSLVSELGDTLDGRQQALQTGLHAAPGGLDETSGVLRELSADSNALRTLMVAGDHVTSALAAHTSDLGGTVAHAAATFDEFANHARAQQASLDRAPAALRESVLTLARLDSSLVGLHALVNDLAPGALALRAMATPARLAVAQLRTVAPLATSTLRRGRSAAPGITRLLKVGTPFLPALGKVLTQLEPMLGCIRPYAPELAGNLSTWAGYNKNFDAGGHYARTFSLLVNPAIVPGTPLNSKQITDTTTLKYAMPRPPGLNAGQPWLLPQCGAGPDALNSAKDPEGTGK
jgi:ABC-type transporter Mla subunit MlaD